MSRPERWVEEPGELPEALLAELRAARSVEPSAEQVSRLRALVLPVGLFDGLSQAAGHAATGGHGAAEAAFVGKGMFAAWSGAVVAKVVGAVLTVGLMAGVYWSTQSGAPGVSAPGRVVMVPPGAGPASPSESNSESKAVAPELAEPVQAPGDGAEFSPGSDAGAGPPANASRAPARRPGAPAASGSPQSPARLEEVRLLQAARAQLGSDPGEALALTRRHQAQFPKALLGQEREVIAIEALLRLGQSSEARQRFEQFRASYAASPHQSRLEVLVGKQQPPLQ